MPEVTAFRRSDHISITGQDRSPAQAIEDLLTLTHLAAGVSSVALGYPWSDGSWKLKWGGGSTRPPVPHDLLTRIASHGGPLEIPDLEDVVPHSSMVRFPYSLRWAFGVAIRDDPRNRTTVLVLLDTCLRSRSHREDQALRHAARRARELLAEQASEKNGRPWVRADDHLRIRPESIKTAQPMNLRPQPLSRLRRSNEVAAMFDVTERTVLNWAASGKLPSIRTVGGHLRFREDDLQALLGSLRTPHGPRA